MPDARTFRMNPLLGRAVPALTPVRMGGATGRVGEFGLTRVDAAGKPKMHKGLDLLSVVGWPVFAVHGGTVEASGYQNPLDPHEGYGQRVRILAAGFQLRSVYAHLSRILVATGAAVAQGDLIGLVGRSGNISEDDPTHLHFEVHIPGNGALFLPVNPEDWMLGRSLAGPGANV